MTETLPDIIFPQETYDGQKLVGPHYCPSLQVRVAGSLARLPCERTAAQCTFVNTLSGGGGQCVRVHFAEGGIKRLVLDER